MSSPLASKPPPPHPPRLPSELLQTLNPQQREAVLAAGGPALILAGAGTGKTRVIAHRIAYLLQTVPELVPSHVLALTFSKKAAQEMLERVESLLGTYADELGVFTFHGFCHRFLQDYAVESGLPARFRLFDRVEAWFFFRGLLPELKPVHHWNIGDPTACIDGFLRFISRAKDELVGCEQFAEYVKGVSDPSERARLDEVGRVYRIYQERMRSAGALDFGDLIVETIRILQSRPALLARLKDQYRSILVDEFQDTNVAQITLLSLLAGETGSLCVVGDDDQAIYRFRGASFASFLLMKEVFPRVGTIRLTQNYRSTPQILSVAERLIRHNEPDRYDPEKSLWTENPKGIPVEVSVCRDEWDEAQAACAKIQVLYQGQPEGERGFDRIAVLYRAHAHRERLLEALRLARIPFAVQGRTSLLEQEEIKELVSFLRVVHDPADSVSAFRLLSHPIWGIPPEDLKAISRSAKERGWAIRQALGDLKDLPLSDPTRSAAAQLLKELRSMEREAFREGVGSLIPRAVEATSLRILFQLPPAEGGRHPLSYLGRFLRLTYRYAEMHPEAQDLGSFLVYLDAILQVGLDPGEEEAEPAGDQVRLMTIHQAKGLEFDWVILLGLVQGRFPTRKRPEPIPFPLELMKEPLPKGDYHLQEERRLFYVACTRARKGLFFLTQERAYHRPSVFIREVLESGSPSEIVRRESPTGPSDPGQIPSKPQRLWDLIGSGSWAREREVLDLLKKIRGLDPKDEEGYSQTLQRITEAAARLRPSEKPERSLEELNKPGELSRFSYTQLETYRYCPMKYLYKAVYQIPVRPTPQMAFGIDLHVCLEDFFKKVIAGQVPLLQELLDDFRRRASPGRYGEPFQDQEYQHLGVELLTAFYNKNEGRFAPPLFVEKAFSLQWGDAAIRGVVDRIDPLPEGGVEILDYKSGKPKEEADSDEQLQLRLYALACREVFQLEPKRLSFYFLKNNQKLSFELKPSDLVETKEKILELIRQIRTGDFTPTPSQPKCRRCDFRNLCPASKA